MRIEKYSPQKKHIVLTGDQVRAFDGWAINKIGVPGVVLMENAGRSCAEIIKNKLQDRQKSRVCIFCGSGNNGGDGYVIARHLLNAKFDVKVVLCADYQRVKGDARINLDILESLDHNILSLKLTETPISAQIKTIADDADIVVDAIFGTGMTGKLKDPYDSIVNAINELDAEVFAVDIPSGLDCDSGKPLGTAIKADCTVTFAAMKKGFVASEQAYRYTGEIYIASIGVEPTSYNIT